MKFIDLHRQYKQYQQEIDAQISDVIENTAFIMGPKIAELEELLAHNAGVKYAVACSSGTDALLLALMAYDIRPGDEIITTTFSFIATAEVVAFLKATPVFVDVDPETYNIDPERIKNAVTEKTRGIIAVDIFGQCADYDAINAVAKENNLFVIEDAAQSFGARYKDRPACSLSGMACTSFFPAKPLGCYGDGGMVFTDDAEKAGLMNSFRGHGQGTHRYDHVRIGLNARLDALQAAVLLAKFPRFSAEITARNRLADYYNENLDKKIKTPVVLDHNLSTYAQYSIRVALRDELQVWLKDKGIPSAIHYPKPLHLQPAFSYLNYAAGDCPVAENICENIISLPMHPFLTDEEMDLIIHTVNDFIEKHPLSDSVPS